jgi:hypothetical protein
MSVLLLIVLEYIDGDIIYPWTIKVYKKSAKSKKKQILVPFNFIPMAILERSEFINYRWNGICR